MPYTHRWPARDTFDDRWSEYDDEELSGLRFKRIGLTLARRRTLFQAGAGIAACDLPCCGTHTGSSSVVLNG